MELEELESYQSNQRVAGDGGAAHRFPSSLRKLGQNFPRQMNKFRPKRPLDVDFSSAQVLRRGARFCGAKRPRIAKFDDVGVRCRRFDDQRRFEDERWLDNRAFDGEFEDERGFEVGKRWQGNRAFEAEFEDGRRWQDKRALEGKFEDDRRWQHSRIFNGDFGDERRFEVERRWQDKRAFEGEFGDERWQDDRAFESVFEDQRRCEVDRRWQDRRVVEGGFEEDRRWQGRRVVEGGFEEDRRWQGRRVFHGPFEDDRRFEVERRWQDKRVTEGEYKDERKWQTNKVFEGEYEDGRRWQDRRISDGERNRTIQNSSFWNKHGVIGNIAGNHGGGEQWQQCKRLKVGKGGYEHAYWDERYDNDGFGEMDRVPEFSDQKWYDGGAEEVHVDVRESVVSVGERFRVVENKIWLKRKKNESVEVEEVAPNSWHDSVPAEKVSRKYAAGFRNSLRPLPRSYERGSSVVNKPKNSFVSKKSVHSRFNMSEEQRVERTRHIYNLWRKHRNLEENPSEFSVAENAHGSSFAEHANSTFSESFSKQKRTRFHDEDVTAQSGFSSPSARSRWKTEDMLPLENQKRGSLRARLDSAPAWPNLKNKDDLEEHIKLPLQEAQTGRIGSLRAPETSSSKCSDQSIRCSRNSSETRLKLDQIEVEEDTSTHKEDCNSSATWHVPVERHLAFGNLYPEACSDLQSQKTRIREEQGDQPIIDVRNLHPEVCADFQRQKTQIQAEQSDQVMGDVRNLHSEAFSEVEMQKTQVQVEYSELASRELKNPEACSDLQMQKIQVQAEKSHQSIRDLINIHPEACSDLERQKTQVEAEQSNQAISDLGKLHLEACSDLERQKTQIEASDQVTPDLGKLHPEACSEAEVSYQAIPDVVNLHSEACSDLERRETQVQAEVSEQENQDLGNLHPEASSDLERQETQIQAEQRDEANRDVGNLHLEASSDLERLETQVEAAQSNQANRGVGNLHPEAHFNPERQKTQVQAEQSDQANRDVGNLHHEARSDPERQKAQVQAEQSDQEFRDIESLQPEAFYDLPRQKTQTQAGQSDPTIRDSNPSQPGIKRKGEHHLEIHCKMTDFSAPNRQERVKPIAIRTWGKRRDTNCISMIEKRTTEENQCERPISQPAKQGDSWNEEQNLPMNNDLYVRNQLDLDHFDQATNTDRSAFEPCELNKLVDSDRTVEQSEATDIDHSSLVSLEPHKLNICDKSIEHDESGACQNPGDYLHNQTNRGYRDSTFLLDLNVEYIEPDDTVTTEDCGWPIQLTDGFSGKESSTSSSDALSKPDSRVLLSGPNDRNHARVCNETFKSDSGSSITESIPDIYEPCRSSPSRHVSTSSSFLNSKGSADESWLGEEQAQCLSSTFAHKSVVIHSMFRRPVAIKSKTCYEVVKKKPTLPNLLSEEHEQSTVKLNQIEPPLDQIEHVVKKASICNSTLDENEPSPRMWDSKRNRGCSVLSKLQSMKMLSTSQEWQVTERPTAELTSQKSKYHGKENAARCSVMEARRNFERLRQEALQQGGELARRADMRAGMLMKRSNLRVNYMKRIGSVPGVEVGDQFFFRMEMLIVGLHMQIQAGIDFKIEFCQKVATSIVASVGLDYDFNGGDTLVYTGQGGKVHKDGRIQEDQKLVRGNLALKNSYEKQFPVRVIRCYSKKYPNTDRIYTYDGLYKVESFWKEKGISGCLVYKFRLQRLPGQKQLVSPLAISPS